LAIKREVDALLLNRTWTELPEPKGVNIVSSRWVFDVKYDRSGNIERFKARLVARGFSQSEGIDFDETFGPTMRFDSLRTLLAVVALKDLECDQVGVNNAFTNAILTHDIYMSPPPGYPINLGRVLKVQKSLYGLKQAARDWHEDCARKLSALGFSRSGADPCVFYLPERGLVVDMYVDDLVIAAPRRPDVNWFKTAFAKYYKIKDLGEIKKVLGLRVQRKRSGSGHQLTIDQEAYVEKVLARFKMLTGTHRGQNVPLNGYDGIAPSTEATEPIDRTLFQEMNGSVMHLAVWTRPNISFTVGKLSQHMVNPGTHHG